MDIDRNEIAAIANGEITKRFQDVGIDDGSFQAKQATIANFVFLNDQREARDKKSGEMRRSFGGLATSVLSQIIVFVLVALVAVFFPKIYQIWSHLG